MKKQNDTILISQSLDEGDFHYDDDCPICRLMREKETPSAEELKEAFEQAKELGHEVRFIDPDDEEDEKND